MSDYLSTVLDKDIIQRSLEATDDFVNKTVLVSKYLAEGETCYEDIVNRMTKAINEHLPSQIKSEELVADIRKLLSEKKFIPGGSVLSVLGADTKYKSSLANCYVVGIGDSLEEIGDCMKDMMRTYSYRGGCGTDITKLRPHSAACRNSARTSSGAVSFVPMLSMVTRTIGQHGRRGALMVTINVNHPDIMQFIWAKADTKRVIYTDVMDSDVPNINRANMSVQITDEFMSAVENDLPWVCKFPNMDDMELYSNFWNGNYDDWENLGGTFDEYRTYSAYVYNSNLSSFIGSKLAIGPNDHHLKDFVSDDRFYQTITDCKGKWMLCELTEENIHLLPMRDNDVVTEYNFAMPSAREILTRISEATLLRADPGVMFIDHMHNYSWTEQVSEKLRISTTNPCGEIPLPIGGACNLGAHDISKYVINPWTPSARFDKEAWEKATRLAVIIMDTLVTVNIPKHPLDEQRDMDEYSRRIGIEFCGLADAVAMLGMNYSNNEETMQFIDFIMGIKCVNEIKESVRLAKDVSPCPAISEMIDRQKIIEHDYFQNAIFGSIKDRWANADKEIESLTKDILLYGLRNSSLSTVGPTGSISIIAGNTSSGIEPLFSVFQLRSTRIGDGGTFSISNINILSHLLEHNSDKLEKGLSIATIKEMYNLVEAHDMKYLDRIAIQAHVQKYTDNSISSTINMPQGTTTEDIFEAYQLAHKAKCKGITIYVDKTMDGVLNVPTSENIQESNSTKNEDSNTTSSPQPAAEVVVKVDGVEYPAEYVSMGCIELDENGCVPIKKIQNESKSITHKIKWAGTNIYIFITLDENNRPNSIFSTVPRNLGYDLDGNYDEALFNSRSRQWETATRMSSLCLRAYVPIDEIRKQLDSISMDITDPMSWISRILSKYEKNGIDKEIVQQMTTEEIIESNIADVCPQCKQSTYVISGGCGNCYNPECLYTKCG